MPQLRGSLTYPSPTKRSPSTPSHALLGCRWPLRFIFSPQPIPSLHILPENPWSLLFLSVDAKGGAQVPAAGLPTVIFPSKVRVLRARAGWDVSWGLLPFSSTVAFDKLHAKNSSRACSLRDRGSIYRRNGLSPANGLSLLSHPPFPCKFPCQDGEPPRLSGAIGRFVRCGPFGRR